MPLRPIMVSPAVSVTATDHLGRRQRRPSTRFWSRALRALALMALMVPLAGCVEEPLPKRKISNNDCLREVDLEQLKAAIKRCDAVVAAFPNDPTPLNERFVLHSLSGDTSSACQDITRAAALARDIPGEKLDAMLRKDLELRTASCRS